ncbi:YbjN domain-containing protein [Mesorhizobium sp. M00.F.Ca.ET.186.01.1.1]|nr:YbjN domain-containing protein [bacterium M00.F.Ca.ET.205.01.1.1]TGU47325.1 YbjN domain-containing protein [bacterium M00.F.Ca.ET.152.01.1.1]TGV31869.1 YbjN domain-containing protein [Mesorhizobium sp. M00.F.Ca.ET.186.01.1.1]TGZ39104.1 YbjN domain-containing protein [bacterium M00.F.Ca.ET.162.01.1.1]
MRSFSLLLSVGLVLTGAVSVAWAEDAEIIKAPDPAAILEIAKGFGSAKMDKDDGGDPMVSGRLQGMKYVIYFYGCEDHEKCKSIQFSSGYTDAFTAEQANEWNKKYRWVKAFSGDGSNFKMDVSFAGGITKANLEGQFTNWDSITSDIKDFINQK